MKINELLFEVRQGKHQVADDVKNYWAVMSGANLHTIPKTGNNYPKDVYDFSKSVGDDKAVSPEYDKPSKNGFAAVLGDEGKVDLDVSVYTRHQNRRPAGKISNQSRSKAVPILGGETGVDRAIDAVKFLKALVRRDPATADYQVVGDDRFEGQTVRDVITKKQDDHTPALTRKGKGVFYHGTSGKMAEKIMKVGLRPGQREEAYADLVPGYSENNVYLTSKPSEAANYATRQALDDNSSAVILKIVLNEEQLNKLGTDEGSMHWLNMTDQRFVKSFFANNPWIEKIWNDDFQVHFKHLGHKEQRYRLQWLYGDEGWGEDEKRKAFKAQARKVLADEGYTEENILDLEQRMYKALMKTFQSAAFKNSAARDGTVVYPGKIPPSQIEQLKEWKVKGTSISSDASNDEYEVAIKKQAETVKRGKK